LGIEALSDSKLEFVFSENDPEFEYKLIHPALSPLPPGGYLPPAKSAKQICSGPYRIAEWTRKSHVRLEPNAHYPSAHRRPAVEAWFVDDDTTALRLYESDKLDFLRRLTATEIPRYKKSPQFHQIPMARFDYVGFGPELRDQGKLREALSEGIDFKSFLKIFDTQSPPGCPSLPARMLDRVHCQKPDFKKARTLLKELKKPISLEFHFSQMGGDDIARQAEWFQGQWKDHLGLKIGLIPAEQGLYVRRLRADPPAVFRKGVSLDRPTCTAALEIFLKDNPENYLKLDDKKYERLVRETREAKTASLKKTACRRAVDYLMDRHLLIPLGEMYFTVLAKPRFAGWDLNELNQLDLSELHPVLD
jgi:oligopeptide transport system substrate-binding protein